MAGIGSRGEVPSTTTATLAAGDVIGGKYVIESVLGEGGMGTVYAAYHQLLDITVAIKVLSPDLAQNRAVIDRFLREARAVARLKSEHVARVMDVGTLEAGQPYIVMELLDGEDLEHRFERTGKLPVADAVDCVLQALEAVAHAHAAGIVHRDLKPANLFLASTPDGREIVKVLDFGIAKLSPVVKHDGARSLTGEHTVLGSPSYMSPEQVRDSSVIDHRADLWALGVILYEMVTGREPFAGGSVGEVFGAILHATPVPLRQLEPDVSPDLEAAVVRCLTREVDRRFSSVAELARALAPFGSGAWDGHLVRIEQTLARSQRWSENPASSPRLSLLSMRPRSSSIPVATPESPGAPTTPRVAFSRSGEQVSANSETVAEPSLQAQRRRLWSPTATAISGLLFGAVLSVIGIKAVPRLRGAPSASGALPATVAPSDRAAPSPPSIVAVPPFSTLSPTPSAAPSPVLPRQAAGSSDGVSASAFPSDAGGTGTVRPAPKRPPAAATKARTTSPGGLPGVLDSPD
jgi:serine/threonine-protein kinase